MVQLATLMVVLWMGVDFVIWFHTIPFGDPLIQGPSGVEGFLPTSALIPLRLVAEYDNFSQRWSVDPLHTYRTTRFQSST